MFDLKTQESQQAWKKVQKDLHSYFHFKKLRPGQEQIIHSILAGHDTLAIMPTGAGKSLCYQLPALQSSGVTIVITPLISLMKDQYEKLEENGISAVELNSSLTSKEIKENITKIENSQAGIIYVMPERFSNPEFLEMIEKLSVDFVAIDEVHCISQWGHDFRPAYLSIRDSLKRIGSPPILGMTATATEEVAEDIQTQLGSQHMAIFRSSVLRKNLRFEARYLNKPEEKIAEIRSLLKEMPEQSGIIYTATVKAANEIHRQLEEAGISSLLYHGKMKKKERDESQNEFMNHSPRLMIATNAFGMGIDKSDIRFVIHFQFPGTLEAYYQEAGRAGRDGLQARCILLYLKRDKCTQSLFMAGKYPSSDQISTTYLALQKLKRSGASVSRHALDDTLKDAVPKAKVSVILSLLKQMKILKESRAKFLELIKDHLTELEIRELSVGYQTKTARDHEKLNRVIQYAQSALCRWRSILHYFNEKEAPDSCESCDNCLRPDRRALAELL